MKNYLSFGAGVNSVALYLLMQDLGIEFEAVFVDHGGDWPETYEYVDYFIGTGRPVTVLQPEYHRKKAGITYNNLYEYSWAREMVPSMMMRWCTRDFKVHPVHRYIEKPCHMHIGIDAGESHRAKISSTAGVEQRYLLVEHDINRDGCVELIKKAGLRDPGKSGCYFCPYQRKGQWLKLRREHPDLFCKVQQLEKRNMEYRVRKGKTPFALRGDGKTLDMLVNENQMALPGLESEIEYPPCQCGL